MGLTQVMITTVTQEAGIRVTYRFLTQSMGDCTRAVVNKDYCFTLHDINTVPFNSRKAWAQTAICMGRSGVPAPDSVTTRPEYSQAAWRRTFLQAQ